MRLTAQAFQLSTAGDVNGYDFDDPLIGVLLLTPTVKTVPGERRGALVATSLAGSLLMRCWVRE